ncbi:lytic murein transglycosylase B [Massilia sp. 9096]|uniref:lytic murein transglycosylase B n=1 Tax=Massilia sp. 9096 TaxID=1500894 RepID=UPI000565477F|nr:lytic murein transglycosylase B [Massilia sp. 9096]
MKAFVSLSLAVAFAAQAFPALASTPHHGGKTAVAAKAKTKSAAKDKIKAKAQAAAARPGIDYDGEDIGLAQWQAVRDFEDEIAARDGFTREELDAVAGKLRYLDSAVQLVKPAPPGKPKNWQAYSARFIEPIRVGAGVRFWNENAEALARAESTYGVPAQVIVGIIGVETIYGRDTGRFRIMDVLATLAFAYPEAPNQLDRKAFFRDELESTLLLARKEGIDPFSLQGSFAGAVGMPQFMPGNILKFGVDFDGDGVIDLRNSAADAIGSVANFLVQHGWERDNTAPAAVPANVAPSQAWQSLLGGGLEARYRPDELAGAGVAVAGSLPDNRLYGLVDLQNGADPTEYWVANANFFAITKYNRSYFYAMSVLELGRAVRSARDGGY